MQVGVDDNVLGSSEDLFEGLPLDMSAFSGDFDSMGGEENAAPPPVDYFSNDYGALSQTAEAVLSPDVMPETRKRARSTGKDRRLKAISDPLGVAAAAFALRQEGVTGEDFLQDIPEFRADASLVPPEAGLLDPLSITTHNVVYGPLNGAIDEGVAYSGGAPLNSFPNQEGLFGDLSRAHTLESLIPKRQKKVEGGKHRRNVSDPTSLHSIISGARLDNQHNVFSSIDQFEPLTHVQSMFGYAGMHNLSPPTLDLNAQVAFQHSLSAPTSPAGSASLGESIEALNLLDDSEISASQKPRKRYLCGRCGKPKVGHVCTSPDMRNMQTQVDIGITTATKYVDSRSYRMVDIKSKWVPLADHSQEAEDAVDVDVPENGVKQ